MLVNFSNLDVSEIKDILASNPDIKNYLEDYQKVYDTYSKIILSEDKDINLVPLAD